MHTQVDDEEDSHELCTAGRRTHERLVGHSVNFAPKIIVIVVVVVGTF